MRTRLLESVQFGKSEALIFILAALFIAELAVFHILGQDFGPFMAKGFASMVWAILAAFLRFCKWGYRMVGPVLFPLLALTFVEVRAVVKLIQCWRSGSLEGSPEKQYKTLAIVEGVSPGFGFLGTCLGAMATMNHMDPNLTQTAMLKVLLENSSSAFGSTVFGITLAIGAFLSCKLFKEYLIHEENDEDNPTRGREANASMNVLRREV